jgi:hypothetical protein
VARSVFPWLLRTKNAMGFFHGFFFEIAQRRKGHETNEGIPGRE